MHPAFALVSEKLTRLAVETEKFLDAEQSVHARLLTERTEASVFVATNSRASSIESIYTGMESILKDVLAAMNEHVYDSKGEGGHRWHAQLIAQLSQPTKTRNAVISKKLAEMLDKMRRFRHLERNIYGHELEPNRVSELVNVAVEAAKLCSSEVYDFIEKIEVAWAPEAKNS